MDVAYNEGVGDSGIVVSTDCDTWVNTVGATIGRRLCDIDFILEWNNMYRHYIQLVIDPFNFSAVNSFAYVW